MTTLGDRILQLAGEIRRYKTDGLDKRLSEQDTKALLVEPLLKAVGWHTSDPARARRKT